MKLIAPILGRDEQATPEGIAEVVPLLKGRKNPFAILEQSKLTYVQTLWTTQGYDLEYQEQNVLNHYRIKNLLNEQHVVAVLQSYLNGDPNWNSGFEFERKDIVDVPAKAGFSFGQFCGYLIRGFKEARNRKRSSNTPSEGTR